jgi:hypothetical protein
MTGVPLLYLRVWQKNIDVPAFAMVDLQHHRCATAERPRIDNCLPRIGLMDQGTSYSK